MEDLNDFLQKLESKNKEISDYHKNAKTKLQETIDYYNEQKNIINMEFLFIKNKIQKELDSGLNQYFKISFIDFSFNPTLNYDDLRDIKAYVEIESISLLGSNKKLRDFNERFDESARTNIRAVSIHIGIKFDFETKKYNFQIIGQIERADTSNINNHVFYEKILSLYKISGEPSEGFDSFNLKDYIEYYFL